MYVSVHVCVSVYLCVCVCLSMCVCLYVSVYVCLCAYSPLASELRTSAKTSELIQPRKGGQEPCSGAALTRGMGGRCPSPLPSS